MNISLDYDNTYTRDPKAWNQFIDLMLDAGHKVMCVTMRTQAEGMQVLHDLGRKIPIYFTSRRAKKDYMFEQGINIDVWIDDMPFFVVQDAADRQYIERDLDRRVKY